MKSKRGERPSFAELYTPKLVTVLREGYGLADMEPALLALTVAALLFWPVLGERRPDLVSFLPSLRQYSGNWATSMWAFAPGLISITSLP